MSNAEKIAVIDTETNWSNRVMSVGVVVADGETFSKLDMQYCIFDPEYKSTGMYSDVLFDHKNCECRTISRKEAMEKYIRWLQKHGVKKLFAYNASFDKRQLPELSDFEWYDIIKIAAYKQFNPAIPSSREFCASGRLKRNYGVEAMYNMLSPGANYIETHNAINDAQDELVLMQLLNLPLTLYEENARIV